MLAKYHNLKNIISVQRKNSDEEDMGEDMLIEEEEEIQKEQEDESGSLVTWISQNIFLVVVVLALLLVLKLKLKDWRQRWFAALLNYYSQGVDVKREKMKKDLFACMRSVKSCDPELRKVGAIKVLEIGVGTGANFAYYPEGTRLTVVDPNPHFKQYYNENRKKFPNIHSEDIILTTGEDMDMIPDNSIDVVVVTQVLCSVPSIEKILKQILRVLAPGGKFYLYEHIKEFDTKTYPYRSLLQIVLTKTGIWQFFLDECCLDRDMLESVQKTGFSRVEMERFHAEINHLIFQLVSPSLKGVAVK